MEQEIWKPVKKAEGYEVSNLGNVRSVPRKVVYKDGRITFQKGRILKQYENQRGYLKVYPTVKGKTVNSQVHRLVAEAFIPNPDNKPQVNHINCDKLDNSVDNLEWVTNEENYAHAIRNGLITGVVPVDVYTIEGDYVASYDSMTEAARQTGAGKGNVNKVVKGKANSAKGYIFKKATKE